MRSSGGADERERRRRTVRSWSGSALVVGLCWAGKRARTARLDAPTSRGRPGRGWGGARGRDGSAAAAEVVQGVEAGRRRLWDEHRAAAACSRGCAGGPIAGERLRRGLGLRRLRRETGSARHARGRSSLFELWQAVGSPVHCRQSSRRSLATKRSAQSARGGSAARGTPPTASCPAGAARPSSRPTAPGPTRRASHEARRRSPSRARSATAK